MVIICVNQEKEAAAAAYGPPQKTITGGKSQVFKDGHMISSSYKTLASGDGKILTLKTTKTSFCDPRKIEVAFRWNKYGDQATGDYGHHFEWAMASAKCLADPEKGVGEIRDICDVKVADSGLVTCPTFGLKSVPAEEFEAALFDSSNSKVLDGLYNYMKIERIKDMSDYKAYVKARKDGTFHEPPPEPTVTVTKKKGKKLTPVMSVQQPDTPPGQEEQSES